MVKVMVQKPSLVIRLKNLRPGDIGCLQDGQVILGVAGVSSAGETVYAVILSSGVPCCTDVLITMLPTDSTITVVPPSNN